MKKAYLYCRIKNKQKFDISYDHPMYCCIGLIEAVNHDAIPVSYNSILRFYYLICDTRVSWRVPLKRCFLCGNEFPEDLHEKMLAILKNDYGIADDSEHYRNDNLPEEFYTEEWWRKRQL